MKNYLATFMLIASLSFPSLLSAQHNHQTTEIAIGGKYHIKLKPSLRNQQIEWEVAHNFPNVSRFHVALSTDIDTIACNIAHPAKSFTLPKLGIDLTSDKVQLQSFSISYIEYGQTFTLTYEHALQSFTMYKDGVYYQYANDYALLNNSATVERQHIASRE